MQFKLRYTGSLDVETAVDRLMRLVRSMFPDAMIWKRGKGYTLELGADNPDPNEVDLLKLDLDQAMFIVEE